MSAPTIDSAQGEELNADRTRDGRLDDWVAARGMPALLRLAYVLTGNRADAEDAVAQEALARALPRWENIRTVGDPDAYVRRMVVNAHTSWWRKFRRRETPVPEAFTPGVHSRRRGGDERDRVWAACLGLPEAQRVAVVPALLRTARVRRDRGADRGRGGQRALRVSRGLVALREALGEENDDV